MKLLTTNYPFRFEGPKVGDSVFWVCVTVMNDVPEILETKIVGVHDSYDFMPRTDEDLPRETWCIFYDVEDYPYSSLTFGDDLFLTREEAEDYIRDCKETD